VLGHSFVKTIGDLRELVGEVQCLANILATASADLGPAADQTTQAVMQVSSAVQSVARHRSDVVARLKRRITRATAGTGYRFVYAPDVPIGEHSTTVTSLHRHAAVLAVRSA
jgi:hypothetical protein